MKKLIVLMLGMLFAFAGTALGSDLPSTLYIEVVPTTSTYTKGPGFAPSYTRTDVVQRGAMMGFSGTSPCGVIDTDRLGLDLKGYYTFQFTYLGGVTDVPHTGTTISVHWKGSNVDTADAWALATKNTIVNGINAYSGATNVGFDINDITGVTAFRYIRPEFESGVSTKSKGNLIPIGLIYVR